MISAIIGVIAAFNVSVYLVLAAFLKDGMRKPAPVHFPELTGLVTKGKKRVTWARARSSLAAQSNLCSQPQDVLRRLHGLCSPRDRREELPLYSIDCTDLRPCRGTGFTKMQSWPPAARDGLKAPGLPPLSLSRTSVVHYLRDSPPKATASSAPMTSALRVTSAPLMTAAEPTMMSAEEPLTSAVQPTPERESAGAAPSAAAEVYAAADAAEGLLGQALRVLYKQHYGVTSVMVQDEVPHQEGSPHCFLERQHSPTTPLDIRASLPGTHPLDAHKKSPFYRFSPSESVCGDSVNGDADEDRAAAAGLPELPSLSSWANSSAAPILTLQPPQSVFIVSTWRLRDEEQARA